VPFDESKRIRFHQWLITHDLEQEIADAILSAMQPFDWHELATRSDIVGTRADIATVKSDVGVLKVDVATLKTDITTLKTDVTTLKTDVTTLKVDVATLKTDVTTIQTEMNRRFDLTDDRLKGVAHEVRALIFAMMGVIVSVLLAGAASVWA
jgi:septal ring factor EnvC (AmiA/AmiB activator)